MKIFSYPGLTSEFNFGNKTSEELQSNLPCPDPSLVWDKPVYLSTNALHTLLFLCKEYRSECEPWETGLMEELVVRLQEKLAPR
jgi:hypothetical protein